MFSVASNLCHSISIVFVCVFGEMRVLRRLFFFTRIHNYTSSVDLPILVSPTEVDLYSFSKPNVDNNRRARNKK